MGDVFCSIISSGTDIHHFHSKFHYIALFMTKFPVKFLLLSRTNIRLQNLHLWTIFTSFNTYSDQVDYLLISKPINKK